MKLSLNHLRPLVLLVLAGCAGVEEETPASRAARTDLKTAEAGHYVVVRRDARSLWVARAGADETACADRVMREACEVAEVDLSRADLVAEDEESARARIDEGSAIVRAKLVSGDDDTGARLVVTELWTREKSAASLAGERAQPDALFVLRDVHEGCDIACSACAWLRAEPLSGGRAAHYVSLELGALGASLGDGERQALAEGRLLARGAGIGTAFVAVELYARFPLAPRPAAPPAAPAPGDPIR